MNKARDGKSGNCLRRAEIAYVARALIVSTSLISLAACNWIGAPSDTDWPFLGNSPEMQHHSDLEQINTTNVGRLGLAWISDMPTRDGLVGNPLVQDGRVFQSGSLGRIFATDLRTGKSLWTYEPAMSFEGDSLAAVWSKRYNRGLALSGNFAIVANGCSLVAVDQKTGNKTWEAPSCDSRQSYGITGAPRVGGGLVFIGNNCADSGNARGYVDAFDARTGKHAWRFYTVPGDPAKPPEDAVQAMAAKTWGSDWYAKTKGCGSAWDAMTYDPKLKRLYVGVGGPGPFNPALRGTKAGDELFTNSVVALDAQTGKYIWHFKETPNDAWNYDASVGIMVADMPVAGKPRRVVFSVPKSGFFYALDAETGKFISGNNYTKVAWAKGLDANGRPIVNPEARYWEKPGSTTIALPSPLGSHGWEAMAFSPADNLVYVPVANMPSAMKTNPDAQVGGTNIDFYYGSRGDPKWPASGELVAWDPTTQTARWRHRQTLPINGGVLHTSGNLVFEGTADGTFAAFDGKTGKKLWSQQIGGAVRAAPSTVMADGVQYILVPVGNGNSSGTGSYLARYTSTPEMRTQPRLLAFRLDGKVAPPKPRVASQIPRPPLPRFEAALARRGESHFEENLCVDCHGLGAESAEGSTADLRLAPPPDLETFKQVVVGGALLSNGMPKFKDMTPEQAAATYAFVINQAWDAYDLQQSRKAKANGK